MVEFVRGMIALNGSCPTAFADPIEAAGNLSGSRPPRRPTGEPSIGLAPEANSDGGENRTIMPRTFRGDA